MSLSPTLCRPTDVGASPYELYNVDLHARLPRTARDKNKQWTMIHHIPRPLLNRYGYCRAVWVLQGTTYTRYGYCREQPTPGTGTVGTFIAPAGLANPIIKPEPELLQKELHEHFLRTEQPLRASKRCSGAQ
jgi:hypothetical protein